MKATPEFSFLVNCNKLYQAKKIIELEANAQECKALARRFGLISLGRLKLKAFVSRQSIEIVLLNCNFIAHYTQECIVSLKPLKKNIDCTFERIYSSVVHDCLGHESEPQEEHIQNIEDAQDPPDPIIDGYFNLGESVAEQLSLEIDPFPRSMDINFDSFSSSQGKQKSENFANPFAVLEQLKKRL
jgi:uncharacterized metal-binding protein YceD (DUF177 family)